MTARDPTILRHASRGNAHFQAVRPHELGTVSLPDTGGYATEWIAPGISQSTSDGGRTSRTVTSRCAARSSWSSATEMRSALMPRLLQEPR